MSNETINHLIHDRNVRGQTQTGLLDSRYTFSFSDFYDPNRMGFRTLRVINEDRVAPGAGFPSHSHIRYGNHFLCTRRSGRASR